MALHGQFLVNHEGVIGEWWARRLTPLKTDVDEHEYEWEVRAYPHHIDVATTSARGVVTHRYSDGAVVLAAKIMQAAAEQGVGVRC